MILSLRDLFDHFTAQIKGEERWIFLLEWKKKKIIAV